MCDYAVRVPHLTIDDGVVTCYALVMCCQLDEHPADVPHLLLNHQGRPVLFRDYGDTDEH